MNELPLLSICVTCRDNREDFYEDRGGTRLAQKVFQELKIKRLINMRGVKCMSNCKRACILSLTSLNGFTYMFGDIDPNKSEYIKSLEDLISIYKSKTDGFLHRKDRPKLFRSNIVGRFPPMSSISSIITKLRIE